MFREEFNARNTRHRYRAIRIWEQDPQVLLASPALLPLATLAQTDSPEVLLQSIADRVEAIAPIDRQRNVSACVQLIAGLKFKKALINQFFREEVMQESVVYQEIIQKGIQQGIQQGTKQGEITLVLRQLNRRLGAVNPELQTLIQALSVPKLEELAEALLDFTQEADLVNWLNTPRS